MNKYGIVLIIILFLMLLIIIYKEIRKLSLNQIFYDMKEQIKNLSGEPRGIRNNNPFNMRVSNEQWRGEIPREENTDKVFKQFESPEWGIRAGMKLLKNYYNKYGLKSIKDIMNRFAPPSENHTDKYIDFIVNKLRSWGWTDIYIYSDTFLPYNKDIHIAISKAIIEFENGKQPYSDEVFNRAYELI